MIPSEPDRLELDHKRRAAWTTIARSCEVRSMDGKGEGPVRRNLLTDVPGLKVGQAEDPAARTGVTVILPDERAVCAVDVAGGAPGTRETDALQPHSLVEAVDAVVLS